MLPVDKLNLGARRKSWFLKLTLEIRCGLQIELPAHKAIYAMKWKAKGIEMMKNCGFHLLLACSTGCRRTEARRVRALPCVPGSKQQLLELKSNLAFLLAAECGGDWLFLLQSRLRSS